MLKREVLDAMMAGGETAEQITVEVNRHTEVEPSVVRVMLSRLQHRGMIERVARGKYRVALPLRGLLEDEKHRAAVELLLG